MKHASFQTLSNREKEWVEDYLNGTIGAAAFEALQARMMESPALRAALRRYLTLDGYLQDENGAPEPAAASWIAAGEAWSTVSPNTRKKWIPMFWAAAASFIVLAAGIAFLLREPNTDIATIAAINGPVQWTSGNGGIRDDLEVGTKLNGGIIEALLPDSWVEFAFHDGSTITVSGQSVLTVSAGKQKELHLRQGSLSATVSRQPVGFPLLVHTPTAELQVLGTQLNVEAASTSTTLVVNEGRVRFRRLVDGSTAEVLAGFEVTASVDGNGDLGLARRGPAQSLWKSNLPDDAIRGTWISDMDQLAKDLKIAVKSGEISEVDALAKYKKAAVLKTAQGRLDATPILMGTGKADGAPAKAELVVLSVSRGQTHPVRLAPGAVFQIHGRARADAGVSFGLTTHRPNGGFAGKYKTTRRITGFADDTAAFSIEIPIEQFQAMDKTFAASPAGLELTEWWCFTQSEDANLEILQVQILAP